MVDINLYPSEAGPFDFMYRYYDKSNILEVAFRDKSTFTQTDNFMIHCEDQYGAFLWLNEFVAQGLNPDDASGSGKVASRQIPRLVDQLHEASNRNPGVWTGWFYGSTSPMDYRVLEWDDFTITGIGLDFGDESDTSQGSKLSIPAHIQIELDYYVYALRDPRNGEVFYIGKGHGDRIIQHVAESGVGVDLAAESAKLSRIEDIETTGNAVEHIFIRHGIKDEATAFLAEQSVIDAFTAAGMNLTNKVKGHHSSELGLASLDAVLAKFQAEPLPAINQPVIMLKINQLWTPDMSPAKVMEATHGFWVIGPDARQVATYALGIAYGVVRGVYRIGTWHESNRPGDKNRWWFEATDAPEFSHLIGTHVKGVFKQGSSNPYMKFLEGYFPES